jgi:hypothetical protein
MKEACMGGPQGIENKLLASPVSSPNEERIRCQKQLDGVLNY